MGVRKLSTVDAFVVVDLDGAERADGVVRSARKVLQDGARTLARTRTYSWALLGERVSGASAGINVGDGDRAAAVEAFVDELTTEVASGRLLLDPAKGVDPADLAPWTSLTTRSPLHAEGAERLLAAGIGAAAAVALDREAGRTAVVEGAGGATAAIATALGEHGIEVVATGDGAATATTAADVLVCGSKVGLVDHELAAALPQRVVLPCGAAPVTAKGLAVARRRDITVVADFLTLSGPLLAFAPPEGSTVESLCEEVDRRVGSLAAAAMEDDEGMYLGAAHLAEAFLATWQETLPFGRPLA